MAKLSDDLASIPTPPGANAVDSVFPIPFTLEADESLEKDTADDDVVSVGSPGHEKFAEGSLNLSPNKYPREKGHDSLPDDAVPFT